MNLLENSPQDAIKIIESKYDLQSITCHDIHVWDFLRYNLFFELEKQYYKLEDSYQLKKYWIEFQLKCDQECECLFLNGWPEFFLYIYI